MLKREQIGTGDVTINITVQFDTISINLTCADSYAAQVLFDDVVERIQSGHGIMLGRVEKEAKSG